MKTRRKIRLNLGSCFEAKLNLEYVNSGAMTILRDKDRQYLRDLFAEKLTDDVSVICFTQEFECQQCGQTRELLEELAGISDKIKLEALDFQKDSARAHEYGVDKIPAVILKNPRQEFQVRFFGIPSGYEFATLVEDLTDVSRGTSSLSEKSKRTVKSIEARMHIEVFVTPTCPYCPRAVRLAHQMAIENSRIVADMVESIEFPQLANRYSVMAVPKTVVNGKPAFEGALPEEAFIENVILAAGQERSGRT